MEKYANTNGNSGVLSYEIGNNYIWVGFTTGGIYEYTYTSAGREHIENMKTRAQLGSGLNSYIMKYVKKKYSRIIK